MLGLFGRAFLTKCTSLKSVGGATFVARMIRFFFKTREVGAHFVRPFRRELKVNFEYSIIVYKSFASSLHIATKLSSLYGWRKSRRQLWLVVYSVLVSGRHFN